MSKIDAYSAYQSNYYDKSVKEKKDNTKLEKTEKENKTKKTEKTQLELSDRAKELLEELKKKYKNMDFIVADYDSEEEAASYLARGTKEYSVLIEPELLEEMAADEAVKEKYIGILEDSTNQLNQMKEQLGEQGKEVKHIGISVGKDGTVTYFAALEKMSESQRERIEEAKEEKKEEAAKKADKEEAAQKTEKEEAARKADKAVKRTQIEAGSIEELLEKIRTVDWDAVKEEKPVASGGRFDCTI